MTPALSVLHRAQTINSTESVTSRFALVGTGQLQNMEHRLPYALTAPGKARRLAADLVRDRLPQARANEFVVMVSELVANAVCHGLPQEDGQIGLRLEIEGQIVRAVVVDAAPMFSFELPTEPPVLDDPAREPQFGLLAVDRLSDRWGLSLDGKKAVWFEVTAP